MEYEKIKDEINTGDIIFFYNKNNFWVKLFLRITKSQFYHCGIAIWLKFNDKKMLFFIESIPSGRRITNLSTYKNESMIVLRRNKRAIDIPLSSPYIAEYYFHDLLEGIGFINYSLIGFFSAIIYEKTGIRLSSFKGETCSQMIARFLKFKDTDILPGKLYDELTTNIHGFIPIFRIN